MTAHTLPYYGEGEKYRNPQQRTGQDLYNLYASQFRNWSDPTSRDVTFKTRDLAKENAAYNLGKLGIFKDPRFYDTNTPSDLRGTRRFYKRLVTGLTAAYLPQVPWQLWQAWQQHNAGPAPLPDDGQPFGGYIFDIYDHEHPEYNEQRYPVYEKSGEARRRQNYYKRQVKRLGTTLAIGAVVPRLVRAAQRYMHVPVPHAHPNDPMGAGSYHHYGIKHSNNLKVPAYRGHNHFKGGAGKPRRFLRNVVNLIKRNPFKSAAILAASVAVPTLGLTYVASRGATAAVATKVAPKISSHPFARSISKAPNIVPNSRFGYVRVPGTDKFVVKRVQ